jgi:predicted enzyme related to lactoylglutathione lyase
MRLMRRVIVFDALDIEAESTFWATLLGGRVFRDDHWHTVIDRNGDWCIGVQRNLRHQRPKWPTGVPQQQIHLDLHVEDPSSAHDEAMAAGATILQPAPEMTSATGHQVYADPAGHPFCIGWGHPTPAALAEFVARTTPTHDL